MLLFDTGIGLLFIGQPGQVVHTRVQRQGHAAALLEAEIPLTALDLGVGALIYASEHLHFDLCVAALLSELPQSIHIHHRLYYAEMSY